MDRHKDTYRTPVSRLEIVDTGRRRRFSDEAKLRILEESFSGDGHQVSAAAAKHGVSRSQLYRWRQLARDGCGCHFPRLQIDSASPLFAYRTEIDLYSDILLHDMGAGLSDEISEGRAGPQDFRTPPLWGLTSIGPPYLHDGRAKSIDAAIVLHGGEAESTRRRYQELTEADRLALLRFLDPYEHSLAMTLTGRDSG